MSESDEAPNIVSVAELVEGMRIPFAMSVASRRHTGKTYYIERLIDALIVSGKIDTVLVMSPTLAVNNDYGFLPKALRQPYREETIVKLIARQKKVPQEDRQNVLLVCDDVLSEKEAERSNMLKKLFVQGRHFAISIICSSQSANGFILTPTIKNNSDYLLFSRLNRQHLALIYEGGVTNMDKKEFIKYAETNNREWVFLCIDNTSQSTDPAEFIILTKAIKNDKPKKSHQSIYDASSAEEEERFSDDNA